MKALEHVARDLHHHRDRRVDRARFFLSQTRLPK